MTNSPEDTADRGDILGDMMRFGVIESVDLATALCVVKIGDILTPPIPWFERGAGIFSTWMPPSQGEQGLLLCPEGDISGAVFLKGLFSNANPAPSSEANHVCKYPDGVAFSYTPDTKTLLLNLAEGVANIIAAGGLNFTGPITTTGPVTINGPLTVSEGVTVTGEVTASQDVKVGVISLKNHKHGGVITGAAKTLGPE